MSDDLHARIVAAVADHRTRAKNLAPTIAGGHAAWTVHVVLSACDHADDVLARHPHDTDDWCQRCHVGPYCGEVRALADLWLGKGWDQ